VLDPMEYAEMWLRDGGDDRGPQHPDLYGAWLDWFERAGVEAVGLGWVNLRATGSDYPHVRIEDLRQPVDQPVGPEMHDWFVRNDRLRDLDDDALLATAPTLAGDVHLEQDAAAAPGGGFAAPAAQVRQSGRLRRSGAIDPVGVAVLAAADGHRSLAQILTGVAGDHQMAVADLEPAAVGAVRSLIEEGFLALPAGGQ